MPRGRRNFIYQRMVKQRNVKLSKQNGAIWSIRPILHVCGYQVCEESWRLQIQYHGRSLEENVQREGVSNVKWSAASRVMA